MCLAVPGKLLSIEGDDPLLRTGRVSFGGIIKDINLSLVPEVVIGNYVLAHAGFAISIIDEAEADRVFDLLDEIDEKNRAADNAS
ncbi:MAG: HypC/HybG/HupF family hydrogenase formation chaperone [candidate division Zixibacteria bacterium]|nr:HypC/HybG/HupF family hydrogenase formation chaperone [candidate division Zixibacteria bacterium]